MKTIDKIITNLDCKFGAPMGRPNIGKYPYTVIRNNGRICKCDQKKVFDCAVPMNGAYDKGGAYWGLGFQLRVQYTKDLTFIMFYRLGENLELLHSKTY